MTKKLPPIHPGEVLREDFLMPLQLSPLAIARIVGVPRARIEQLGALGTWWALQPNGADGPLRSWCVR
jgi:hypothetical protein